MTVDTSALAAPSSAKPEVERERRVSVGRNLTLVAVVLLALLGTRTVGEYGNSVVVSACITVIVVSGLHVLVHWAGQVSLSQVAFVAIGAFVTARANTDFGLSLPLALVAGVLGAVVGTCVVGVPALRLSGFALAIATLSFGFAADRWLFIQPWLVPVSTGIPLRDEAFLGFELRSSRELVVPVLVLTALVVVLTVRLGGSALGRGMRVVAEDEEVAASYGLSVNGHKLIAFCFAGACAGLAGGLTVMSIGRVGPAVFPPTRSILYLSAVLLGGRGPVRGSIAAAVGLGAFPILAGDLGHYAEVIGPLGILLVIRTSEDGLNGLFRMQAAARARLLERLMGAAGHKERS